MAGYLGEVLDLSNGVNFSSLLSGGLCLGALGLYALFADKPSNDDDDSSPGGGIMQPVA
jgi:hypothetical protein